MKPIMISTADFVYPTFLIISLFLLRGAICERPNIVFVLADDLGWNDVGYSPDSGVETPWIDSLAAQSLRIPWSYTHVVCTPSRAAIMTGLYPFRYGLQRGVIDVDVPEFLDPSLVTLPQLMQQAGYKTHLVGKWHLGFCNERVTPLNRGFDTFHGFLSGGENYFTHQANIDTEMFSDYWNNLEPDRSQNYSTHDFTRHSLNAIRGEEPFFLYVSSQAPHAPMHTPPVARGKILTTQREKFRYVVKELDDMVGHIVTALKDAELWNNTVFIFSSDNGGQPAGGGNNFPLRGAKHSVWEGGTRIRTFIHHNSLVPGKYTGLFHAVDWLPTILGMVDVSMIPEELDGVNHWPSLQDSFFPHPRNSFIYNLDIYVPRHGENRTNAAVRLREPTADGGFTDYKLVLGNPGARSGWYRPGVEVTPHTKTRFENGVMFDMTTKKGRLEKKQAKKAEEVKVRMLELLLVEKLKGYMDPLITILKPSPAAKMIRDVEGRPILGPGWC